MKKHFRPRTLCAALAACFLLPHAAVAQEASATPPDVSLAAPAPVSAASLGDLISGRDIPLSLRLGDLNASWRQFSVGGTTDLVIYAPVDALGAASPLTFFTRGQTASVGSESYLVAYRVAPNPLTPNPSLTKQLQRQIEVLTNRGAYEGSEVQPIKLLPVTELSLCLLNVRQLERMNNIRAFDAASILMPDNSSAQAQEDAAVSVNNLKQIAVALIQYTEDYDHHFPPMQSVSSTRQIQAESQAGTTTHVQVVLLPYAKNAAIFAHPRTRAPKNFIARTRF